MGVSCQLNPPPADGGGGEISIIFPKQGTSEVSQKREGLVK